PRLHRHPHTPPAAGNDENTTANRDHPPTTSQSKRSRRRVTNSAAESKLSFTPGVAANLIGLADLAASDGDRDAARGLLDEADSLAVDSGAHGIARWVGEARDELKLA
ncbi:hypothetical protein ACLQ24_07065, partial [Micromonospora sp. DT4]